MFSLFPQAVPGQKVLPSGRLGVHHPSFLFPQTTFVPFHWLCARLEFGMGSQIGPGGSPSPTLPNSWKYLDSLVKIQILWPYSEILFKMVWGSATNSVFLISSLSDSEVQPSLETV